MRKLLLLLSVLFVVSCSKDPIKYTLTTSVNPVESGAVNPNGGTVDEGQQVSVTASPAAEYLFDKWTGAASGTDKTVSVIMDSDKSVTANFVKKKYALTISVEGEGTVTEKVIKAGVATDYNSGTIVELTAIPSDEWEFKEWTGDLESTENPVQITIDKVKSVKATFERILNYKTELYLSFTEGDGLNQISNTVNGLYVGGDDELIISDSRNYRVMKYTGKNSTGVNLNNTWGIYTNGVMLGDYYGIIDEGKGVYAYSNSYDLLFPVEVGAGDTDLTKLDGPQGMDFLNVGNNTEHNGIYIADTFNHRILFFKWGEKTGKIVAGGNGEGDELNQLKYPTYIEVDIDGTMYIRDHNNGRILKWKVGEDFGEVFLNSTDTPIYNGFDIAMDKNFIYVLGNYYRDSSGNNVADAAVYRINKNDPTKFDLLAGGNGRGNGINQFGLIWFIDVDYQGNLFVADHQNFRVMKISKE